MRLWPAAAGLKVMVHSNLLLGWQFCVWQTNSLSKMSHVRLKSIFLTIHLESTLKCKVEVVAGEHRVHLCQPRLFFLETGRMPFAIRAPLSSRTGWVCVKKQTRTTHLHTSCRFARNTYFPHKSRKASIFSFPPNWWAPADKPNWWCFSCYFTVWSNHI